jgi:hypothetical protein
MTTTTNTEAAKFFGKAEVKDVLSSLRASFPHATFKTRWTVTPYGKPAAIITGEGQVSVVGMDQIVSAYTPRYVYIGAKANTYKFI